jgi:hypothetical protein
MDFHDYDGTWTLTGADRTALLVPKVIRFQGGPQALTVSLDGQEADSYRIDGNELRVIAQPTGALLDKWTRLTILPDALALTTRTAAGGSVSIRTSVLSLAGGLTVETLVSTADAASGTINMPGDPRNVRIRATYERAR